MFSRKAFLVAAAFCISAADSLPAYSKVCQKPNGKYYGIPDQDKCIAPAKEAKGGPISFLGFNVGAKQNYATAKEQGEFKNMGRHWRDMMAADKKLRQSLLKEWERVAKNIKVRFMIEKPLKYLTMNL